MKLKLVLVVTLFAMFFLPASILAFNVPTLQGRVNDNANLLTPVARSQIEQDLKFLEEKTSAQVAVLTVNDLQGQDIKSFSLKVAETWKLGQKGKDNGLLILYTVKEDRYRIEVGYGLEGAIPDGVAGNIIREQLRKHADPKKGARDFDGAFISAAKRISKIILAEYAKDPSGKSMKKSDGEEALLLVLLIVAGFITLLAGCAHEIIGAVVGAVLGGGVAALFSLGNVGYSVLIIGGILIGLLAKILIEALGSGGGGGGSYSSGSWSSSSGDSIFGGGGGFGGGGADG
ncbi:MAG: TPM domain-containing protein [Candidatus Moranbacteria bacterium]|nr:TPM domain-containing protein [Candidatus Moranbacteria bacterium]